MDVRSGVWTYLAMFLLLVSLQPPGMFAPDGCPRKFGTDEGETLLPAWLLALLLALHYGGRPAAA